MAVVDYRVNNQRVGMRAFMVPKRVDHVKYWYKAAQRALLVMPEWHEIERICTTDIDVETIIITWPSHVGEHMVTIARKRQLI